MSWDYFVHVFEGPLSFVAFDLVLYLLAFPIFCLHMIHYVYTNVIYCGKFAILVAYCLLVGYDSLVVTKS